MKFFQKISLKSQVKSCLKDSLAIADNFICPYTGNLATIRALAACDDKDLLQDFINILNYTIVNAHQMAVYYKMLDDLFYKHPNILKKYEESFKTFQAKFKGFSRNIFATMKEIKLKKLNELYPEINQPLKHLESIDWPTLVNSNQPSKTL